MDSGAIRHCKPYAYTITVQIWRQSRNQKDNRFIHDYIAKMTDFYYNTFFFVCLGEGVDFSLTILLLFSSDSKLDLFVVILYLCRKWWLFKPKITWVFIFLNKSHLCVCVCLSHYGNHKASDWVDWSSASASNWGCAPSISWRRGKQKRKKHGRVGGKWKIVIVPKTNIRCD